MEGDTGGLAVGQAASRLGISTDAVRKRIRRGTLRAYKLDGDWRVVLDDPIPTDQVGDPDSNLDSPGRVVQDTETSLTDQLRSEVAFLRQLTEHQAGVIAQQAAAIADLTRRPQELPAGRPDPPTPAPSEPRQEAPQPPRRRPWWRRLLGG